MRVCCKLLNQAHSTTRIRMSIVFKADFNMIAQYEQKATLSVRFFSLITVRIITDWSGEDSRE